MQHEEEPYANINIASDKIQKQRFMSAPHDFFMC